MVDIAYTAEASIPSNTSITLTFKEDTDGDGTANNTETVTLSNGSNAATLSNLAGNSGNIIWFDTTISTSDNTVSPEITSIEVTAGTTVIYESDFAWDNEQSKSNTVAEYSEFTSADSPTDLQKGYSTKNPSGPSGLFTYYPFQEELGSVAYDFSGNGRDGTLNDPAKGANGPFDDSAYNFNGTSDFVETNISETPMENFPATYMIWMSTDDTSKQDQELFRQQNSHLLSYNYDGNNQFRWAVFGTDARGVGDPITDTGLHHVAIAVQSNNNIRLYVDGVEATASLSEGPKSASTTLGIGAAKDTGASYFDGQLSEARLYSQALTKSEIQSIYNRGPNDGTLTNRKKEYAAFNASQVVNLKTRANIPSNTSMSITVNEDTNADNTADNQQTRSIAAGDNKYKLDGFEGNGKLQLVVNLSSSSVEQSPVLEDVWVNYVQ